MQFKFKLGGNMKFGISAGYVQPKKSNAPAFVKARTDMLMGHNSITTYEAGDVSDICEFIATSAKLSYGNGSLQIKPRGKCLLVACVCFPGEDYTGSQDEGEQERCRQQLRNNGFEKVTGMYLASNTDFDRYTKTYCVEVWAKQSNGSMVYIDGNGNIHPYTRFWNISLLALYGATSVDVVTVEAPEYDTTYSYPGVGATSDQNTWYGFTTPAPTGKNRVYYFGATWGGNQKCITDSGTLSITTPRSQPTKYEPITGDSYYYTNNGNLGLGARAFFDTQQNDGLVWWTDSKGGDASRYTPVNASARGIIVLDVNYD